MIMHMFHQLFRPRYLRSIGSYTSFAVLDAPQAAMTSLRERPADRSGSLGIAPDRCLLFEALEMKHRGKKCCKTLQQQLEPATLRIASRSPRGDEATVNTVKMREVLSWPFPGVLRRLPVSFRALSQWEHHPTGWAMYGPGWAM